MENAKKYQCETCKHSMAGDNRDKLYPKVMKKLAHSATLTREDIVK